MCKFSLFNDTNIYKYRFLLQNANKIRLYVLIMYKIGLQYITNWIIPNIVFKYATDMAQPSSEKYRCARNLVSLFQKQIKEFVFERHDKSQC